MSTRVIQGRGGTAVRFEDNSDTILRQIRNNADSAMAQIGDILVEAVQNKILYGYHDVHGLPHNPHTEIVDTERLFDSIDASVRRVSQNAVTTTVGANTPYAHYVHDGTRYHDGTSKLKGRPFITDAVQDSQEEIRRILTGTLPNGLR